MQPKVKQIQRISPRNKADFCGEVLPKLILFSYCGIKLDFNQVLGESKKISQRKN